MQTALYDLSPLVRLLLLGALLATGPVVWVFYRQRRQSRVGRVRALTLMTLFLCFDLILFGAFTRLTDSGLGCPDWPGCYGHASPLGAHEHIAQAQAALPTGPVTKSKAWVEMVHRYLATGVGGLTLVLAALAWWQRRSEPNAPSPWWPTLTLLWAGVQGAFGALTVTMKLFPAIVTLHLLGGYVLLALLTAQAARLRLHEAGASACRAMHPGVRAGLGLVLALLLLQAASGAWVSTNAAVLACNTFPQCQASWWPAMDWGQALDVWHPLGETSSGELLSFQALTAIHWLHRLLALLTVSALAGLAFALWRTPTLRHAGRALAGLLLLQVLTGVSNVVLDWPLAGAVLHTGGAGALGAVLVWLLCTTHSTTRSVADTARAPTVSMRTPS